MKKQMRRSQFCYYVYLVSGLLTIFCFIASIAIVIDAGFTLYFYLFCGGFVLFLINTVIFKWLLARTNTSKIRQPRIGHQGEPGSWQCRCGHFNGAYRHQCVICGRTKQ